MVTFYTCYLKDLDNRGSIRPHNFKLSRFYIEYNKNSIQINLFLLTLRDVMREEIKHKWGVKKSLRRIIRAAIIEKAPNWRMLYATSGSMCWKDLK